MENEFGKRLKEARLAKKMSGEVLGNLVGVKKGAVSAWENGRAKPFADTLDNIAKILDVSVDYLLGAESKKEPNSKTLTVDGLSDLQVDQVKDFIDFLRSKNNA